MLCASPVCGIDIYVSSVPAHAGGDVRLSKEIGMERSLNIFLFARMTQRMDGFCASARTV